MDNIDEQNKESSDIIELVLKGERLCKLGDMKSGIEFLEAAVDIGTQDSAMMSAIYSQLGNAYFYVGDYAHALDYHKHDLNLAQKVGNLLAQAKASGNLGHTLKLINRYDEAISCFKIQLDLSREVSNKIGETRALYNLANAYHGKGKMMIAKNPTVNSNITKFSEDIANILQNAVFYYESNLEALDTLVELDNNVAKGRTYGNLGNTHYLLCNFQTAIRNHEQRLQIALATTDTPAQRRAHTNLGNANIFLGNYEIALNHYKRCLELAKLIEESSLEAEACYSIGNTFTLLKNYKEAINFHIQHLKIVQEIHDRKGEGRACWSLGAAFTAKGEYKVAHQFAVKHMLISREIDDHTGIATAQKNLSDLSAILDIIATNADGDTLTGDTMMACDTTMSECDVDCADSCTKAREAALVKNKSNIDMKSCSRVRRTSMENLNLLKLSPKQNTLFNQLKSRSFKLTGQKLRPLFKMRKAASVSTDLSLSDKHPGKLPMLHHGEEDKYPITITSHNGEDDRFFEQLSINQSRRFDDQRCSFDANGAAVHRNKRLSNGDTGNNGELNELMDMLVGMQGSRMNDQRSDFPGLDESAERRENTNLLSHRSMDDESFVDMIVRCQGSRIEDQRSSLPSSSSSESMPAACVASEDAFFQLIQRLQSNRIDEQRSSMPDIATSSSSSSNTAAAPASSSSSSSASSR